MITILSQLLKVGRAFLSQQTNRYAAMAIFILWPYSYQSYGATYALKCLLFEKKTRKTDSKRIKINFSRFYRKESVLDPMLLHIFNINEAIAIILAYKKNIYDAQELR